MLTRFCRDMDFHREVGVDTVASVSRPLSRKYGLSQSQPEDQSINQSISELLEWPK